ncbi:hypothetical protein DSECCO2_622010 [anaerobic digester metagenome]
MNLKDLLSSFFSRRLDVDEPVKAAGPQKGRVYHIRPVCSGDYDYVFQLFYPVKFRKDLADHSFGNMRVGNRASLRSNGINLIKEDYSRSSLFCFPERFPYRTLGFTHILAEEFWAFNADEISLTFICNSFCKQSFTSTRRPEEKDASRRLYTDSLEHFRIFERPFHRLDKFLFCFLKPAYIVPANMRNFNIDFSHG